jgi:hypothetical protein
MDNMCSIFNYPITKLPITKSRRPERSRRGMRPSCRPGAFVWGKQAMGSQRAGYIGYMSRPQPILPDKERTILLDVYENPGMLRDTFVYTDMLFFPDMANPPLRGIHRSTGPRLMRR